VCCFFFSVYYRNKIFTNDFFHQQHFIDKNGPTSEYPDPVPACGGKCTPSRQLPKKRHLQSDSSVVPVHGKQQKLVVNINKYTLLVHNLTRQKKKFVFTVTQPNQFFHP
jgi:hypothetical protein